MATLSNRFMWAVAYTIKQFFVVVCSTTLWLGHLPKITSDEDLEKEISQYGEIVSINVSAYLCSGVKPVSFNKSMVFNCMMKDGIHTICFGYSIFLLVAVHMYKWPTEKMPAKR